MPTRKSLLYIGVPPSPADGTSRSHGQVALNSGVIPGINSTEIQISNLDPVARVITTVCLKVYDLTVGPGKGSLLYTFPIGGPCNVQAVAANGTPTTISIYFPPVSGVVIPSSAYWYATITASTVKVGTTYYNGVSPNLTPGQEMFDAYSGVYAGSWR